MAVRSTRAVRTVGGQEPLCARCGAAAVDTIEQRHTFRYGAGESAADLTVNLPVRRCRACEFEFLDQESERIKLEAICEHLGVLSPSGIRRVREHYGMTRAEFAEVTGLGTATLVRWENGSMNHTRAYDRYIRLLRDPKVMQQLRELVHPSEPRGRRTDGHTTSEKRWRARNVDDDLRRKRDAFRLRRRVHGRRGTPARKGAPRHASTGRGSEKHAV